MRIDNAINMYIDYCRNTGGKFEVMVRLFNVFSKHFGGASLLSSISRQDCIDFLYEKSSGESGVTSYWFNLYSALDGLFGWARARAFMKENPLPIEKPDRPQAFVPYIYDSEEIKRLFKNAMTYRSNYVKIYPEAIRGIIMLTYFLGLRPGETLKIEMSDVHLGDENYILIKDTKFHKSRLVPFNNKVSMFLEEFIRWRNDRGLPSNPETKVFLDRFSNPYSLSAMDKIFTMIRAKSGIYRYDVARYQPRLMDLRHTFATERVISWYKEKKNVQDLLPVLSTYLGHGSINSTAVYISFTDGLLREAGDRFESYLF